jgi:hypothetical protein
VAATAPRPDAEESTGTTPQLQPKESARRGFKTLEDVQKVELVNRITAATAVTGQA